MGRLRRPRARGVDNSGRTALEDVSGTPFDRYLREHVFEPLGMTSTDVVRSSSLQSRLATGQPVRPEIWDELCGWYPLDARLTDARARLAIGAGAEISVRGGQLMLRTLSPIRATSRGFVFTRTTRATPRCSGSTYPTLAQALPASRSATGRATVRWPSISTWGSRSPCSVE
jgi:CubicO group peptidase (beta-lactamase class C family)